MKLEKTNLKGWYFEKQGDQRIYYVIEDMAWNKQEKRQEVVFKDSETGQVYVEPLELFSGREERYRSESGAVIADGPRYRKLDYHEAMGKLENQKESSNR